MISYILFLRGEGNREGQQSGEAGSKRNNMITFSYFLHYVLRIMILLIYYYQVDVKISYDDTQDPLSTGESINHQLAFSTA